MPVTAPPLKATSSARDTPPRALSATRALARTDTFMPMKPAAPENVPPISEADRDLDALGVLHSSAIASTIASTTATPAMICVLAPQVGLAPSCTAAEMSCISWLPGDCASSQREVVDAVDHGGAGAHERDDHALVGQEFQGGSVLRRFSRAGGAGVG